MSSTTSNEDLATLIKNLSISISDLKSELKADINQCKESLSGVKQELKSDIKECKDSLSKHDQTINQLKSQLSVEGDQAELIATI